MAPRKRWVLLVVVTIVAVSGCGVTARDAREASVKVGTTTTAAALTHLTEVPAQSQRTPGVLLIDGSALDSLSGAAYSAYRRQGGTATVNFGSDVEATAFNRLCSGRIDIVDSEQSMSDSELKACAAHGIRPVQLQVASDAVVLATKAQTDTGADCLTVAQVRAMYRAGSPVTNWNQLGYDDVPVEVAGPGPQDSVFTFFAQYILGEQQPVLLDFRYDYQAQPDNFSIRSFVVGTPTQQAAVTALPSEKQHLADLHDLLNGAETTLAGAQKWVVQSEAQINTGLVDGWPYAERVDNETKYQAALAKETSAQAQVRQLTEQVKRLTPVVSAAEAALASETELHGRLGAFPYEYFKLFDGQLRPLEISQTANPENCIFPSDQTVASAAYPLSRPLLLTVSLNELERNASLRQFLLNYLKNSSELATSSGLVPLPVNVLDTEESWLAGDSQQKPAAPEAEATIANDEIPPSVQ